MNFASSFHRQSIGHLALQRPIAQRRVDPQLKPQGVLTQSTRSDPPDQRQYKRAESD